MSFIAKKIEPTVDLSKPSIPGLIYLLRNPSLWPAGFEFEYRDCKKCAMGLANQVWNVEFSFPQLLFKDNPFGLPFAALHRIFLSMDIQNTTANDVANALEDYMYNLDFKAYNYNTWRRPPCRQLCIQL